MNIEKKKRGYDGGKGTFSRNKRARHEVMATMRADNELRERNQPSNRWGKGKKGGLDDTISDFSYPKRAYCSLAQVVLAPLLD